MHGDHVEILLVEDDLADVTLTKKALESSKLLIHLNHVEDGQKAMDYLKKRNGYEAVAAPDLILLDLNMPVKDGRETLKEIKEDPDLKKIPVVVLTTSEADTDIAKTYSTGANCYIAKPVDFNQFQKVVNEISNFWFTVVKLPH